MDREALCIVAGQKVGYPWSLLSLRLFSSSPIITHHDYLFAPTQVWSVRVDVHLLDHAGNALDCACLAAVTALRHFRKPDVTVVGDEVTVVREPLCPSEMLDTPLISHLHDFSANTPLPTNSTPSKNAYLCHLRFITPPSA